MDEKTLLQTTMKKVCSGQVSVIISRRVAIFEDACLYAANHFSTCA